ncbi:MAG: BamA/TamA family outer membrane protein [Acidobacteria bacterium]|nr:BamA/TamA family outer membrane protein [Acidobacteriota bacterium]
MFPRPWSVVLAGLLPLVGGPQPMQAQRSGADDLVRHLDQVSLHEIRVVGCGREPAFCGGLQDIADRYTRESEAFTGERLEQLRLELTQKYVDSGYVSSGAVIDDQPVVEGRITMRIIEGAAPTINIQGNRWFRKSFYRDRIASGAGTLLNSYRLRDRLQQLHLDDRVRRFDAKLRAVDEQGRPYGGGASVLDVAVEERVPLSAGITFNNYQSPTVGPVRAAGNFAHESLTGRGDALRVGYGRSAGLNPQISASYSLPVTARDATVALGYRKNDFVVVEEPFQSLDISSKSEIFSLGFSAPILLRNRPGGSEGRLVNERASLGATLEHSINQSYLFGQPFSFSAGATNGRSVVTALRLHQDWTRRTAKQVANVSSRLSIGLNLLNPTIHRDVLPPGAVVGGGVKPPDGRFVAWLGQALVARRFDRVREMQLILKSDAQLAGSALLPLEQLPVGGRYSVRGYRQNQLVRDNALTASVESRIPLFRGARPFGQLQGAVFVDFGHGWNNRGNSRSGEKTLASAGVGVRWTGPRLGESPLQPDVEIYWGLPFHRITTGNSGSLQDAGLHFQLSLGRL